MAMECPGRRNIRNLESLIVRCPKCGTPVELFSDEQKVRCRCGEVILREALPSCLRWCPAAERCLGQVIDLREVRKRLEARHKEGRASSYVAEIGRKVKEADRGRKPQRKGKRPKDR